MEIGIGLLRDFVAAGLGLAILFGANFSDDQIAGILLLLTTLAAVVTWGVKVYKARGPVPPA